jgi:hypothetical protein
MSDNIQQSSNLIQSLLREVAVMVGETVQQIEISSSNLGDQMSADRKLTDEIVVELQGFDRMCQMLNAAGTVLRECLPLLGNCSAVNADLQKVLTKIPMRQARHRLEHALSIREANA